MNSSIPEGELIIRKMNRSHNLAIACGLLLPFIIDLLHHFWLHRYVTKSAIRAIEIFAFGIVGGVVVAGLARGMAEALKKYVPLEDTISNATIAKLASLDDAEAWRIFYTTYWFKYLQLFFYFFWAGCFVSAILEYSILPLLD